MSEENHEESVAFDVALNAARQSNDRRTRANLQTLKGWSRIHRNAKQTLASLKNYIAPLDSAVEFHVSRYALTVWTKHRNKHQEIFINMEETEKQMTAAARAMTRIKKRLASRHGWIDN